MLLTNLMVHFTTKWKVQRATTSKKHDH